MNPKWPVFEKLFHFTTWFFALSVLVVMGGLFVSLFWGSIPSIKTFGISFLYGLEWNPNSHVFGALPPMLGTISTTLIAAALGIPLSFGVAVFLTQLCPHSLRQPIQVAVELLAGIPSIVYGIWGLFVFAPIFQDYLAPFINDYIGAIPFLGVFFRGTFFGIGIMPAGIVLAIMIIPFISSVMLDVFKLVPIHMIESARALGASTWEVVWNIILPYSRIGVTGGIMLGLGRALGETMAVAFIVGNSNQFTLSFLMPGSTLSSVLANEFSEATGTLYISSLVELGLVLFLITSVVLVLAKFLLFRLKKREGQIR